MAAMEEEARIASEFVSNIGELQELELSTKSALESADAELATLSVLHAEQTKALSCVKARLLEVRLRGASVELATHQAQEDLTLTSEDCANLRQQTKLLESRERQLRTRAEELKSLESAFEEQVSQIRARVRAYFEGKPSWVEKRLLENDPVVKSELSRGPEALKKALQDAKIQLDALRAKVEQEAKPKVDKLQGVVAALEEKHTEAVRKRSETLSMMREERKQRDLLSDADFARSELLQSEIAALQEDIAARSVELQLKRDDLVARKKRMMESLSATVRPMPDHIRSPMAPNRAAQPNKRQHVN